MSGQKQKELIQNFTKAEKRRWIDFKDQLHTRIGVTKVKTLKILVA